MTPKEKFRLDFACRLEKVFPTKFCWADLVSWAYNSEPFWAVVRLYGHNKGCKIDGEKTACYCGKFGNADYFKS